MSARCTCDYAGMPGEHHKPQCEIEGGPHAECALRIHVLEADLQAIETRENTVLGMTMDPSMTLARIRDYLLSEAGK